MARFIITGEYKDKATKQARKDLKGLTADTAIFGKMAKKYWGIATAAATYYAQKGLRASIRASIEDEKSQQALAFTLMSVAGATEAATIASEANIKSMSMMFGIADDDLRPALARLVRVTGNLTEASQSLDLALSLSVATGSSLESTTAALSRAYTGNYKALRSLGLQIDENLIKSKDTAKILRQLQAQYGDFARNQLNTTAISFSRIRVAAGEASEIIGQSLTAAIVKMLSASGGIDGVAKRFEEMAQYVADVITGLTIAINKTKQLDTETGNVVSRAARWVWQNMTIVGLLQKQGKQQRINTALVKSQTNQVISARNAEMKALKAKTDATSNIQTTEKKTLEQLMAEEAARKAGFKITEDIDSIQTVAAAKRLEESRQYKASVIDAAQAQFDAIKRNYDLLNGTWQVQQSAFDVFLAYLKSKSVNIPVNFIGGSMPSTGGAPSIGDVLPMQAPSFMGNVTGERGANLPSNSNQTINVTVNAGAIGSEDYLVGVIGDALTKYTRYGNTTAPAGFI